jgi:YHS domain-containing protein
MKHLSALLILFTLTLHIGCDKPAAPAPESEKPAATELGFKAACPLCVGHEIEVMSDTPTTTYEGTTYYFCSKHCYNAFTRDPAAAVKKIAAAATQATSKPAAH